MVLWLAETHPTTFHMFFHVISVEVKRTIHVNKNKWKKKTTTNHTTTKGITEKFTLSPCKIS